MKRCDVCGKARKLFPHEHRVLGNYDEIGGDFSKLRIDTIMGQLCSECIHDEEYPVKLDETARTQRVKALRKMYEESKDIHNHT